MNSITLYEYEDSSISIHIHAALNEGKLIISGQDLGDTVRSFWGDSEYEYFYSLSVEDTQKLESLLNEQEKNDDDFLLLVARYFSGVDACKKFQDYCINHGLKVEFSSYV